MSIHKGKGDKVRLVCSFCMKTQSEVKKLIAGAGVFICDECVELCYRIVKDENSKSGITIHKSGIPSTYEIYDFLNQYVIGQDQAKKVLAVAVHNHYISNHYRQAKGQKVATGLGLGAQSDAVEIYKSNVLLMGPTGCGKTWLANRLASALDVPFATADATALTEAGYVGEDVESILLRLLQAADYNVEKAQYGIVYIDEIDKIAHRAGGGSMSRDVSGEGVQQGLLKILEGTTAFVPPQSGKKNSQQEYIPIDTTNILFICGGAFKGIEKIIKARTAKSSIGFNVSVEQKSQNSYAELIKHIETDDLIKFGLIPEFVGRLPVVCTLDDLDHGALVRILTEPKNAIVKQYQALMSFKDVDLRFTDEALNKIAGKAIQRKTGARGLKAIMEQLLLDTMFNLDKFAGHTITVDEQVVEGLTSPAAEKKEYVPEVMTSNG